MARSLIIAFLASAVFWTAAQPSRALAAGLPAAACASAAPACEAPPGPDPAQFTCTSLGKRPVAGSLPTVEAVEACRRLLDNCARDLLGPQADALVYQSGQAVLQINRTQADRISANAKRAREKGSTPEEVALSGQPEILALVAALSAAETSSWSLDDFRNSLSLFTGLSRMVLMERLQGLIDDLWLRIGSALSACRQLSEARRLPKELVQDLPELIQSNLRGLIDSSLLCSLRSRSELVRIPLYTRWPGCPCDHGRGVVLGGACLSTLSPDRFASRPIDQRVVTGTLRFLDTLRARVAPWQPVAVGLDGCTLERLETGPNVRDLHRHPGRGLHGGDISDHARGTACDLVSVTLLGPDCRRWTLELNRQAVGADGQVSSQGTPFFDALEAEARRQGRSWKDFSARARKQGVDAFYQALASGPPPGPDASDASKQLYFGAAVYGALRGARFRVYDPTLNSSHHDHFHFEVPDSDRAWLAGGDTP